MNLQELIDIAKTWEPSEEFLEGYQERYKQFCEEYDKLSDEFKLY